MPIYMCFPCLALWVDTMFFNKLNNYIKVTRCRGTVYRVDIVITLQSNTHIRIMQFYNQKLAM